MTLALFKGDSVSFCISGSSKSYKLPQLGYLLLRADKSSKNYTLYKSRKTLVFGELLLAFASQKARKARNKLSRTGQFFQVNKSCILYQKQRNSIRAASQTFSEGAFRKATPYYHLLLTIQFENVKFTCICIFLLFVFKDHYILCVISHICWIL